MDLYRAEARRTHNGHGSVWTGKWRKDRDRGGASPPLAGNQPLRGNQRRRTNGMKSEPRGTRTATHTRGTPMNSNHVSLRDLGKARAFYLLDARQRTDAMPTTTAPPPTATATPPQPAVHEEVRPRGPGAALITPFLAVILIVEVAWAYLLVTLIARAV